MSRDPRSNPLPGDIFKDKDGTSIIVLEYVPKLGEVNYASQRKDNAPWTVGHKSISSFKVDTLEYCTIQRST